MRVENPAVAEDLQPAPYEPDEIPDPVADPEGPSDSPATGTGTLALLDRVRRKAEIARVNRRFHLPLSHVADGIGLELGLPGDTSDSEAIVNDAFGQSSVESDLEFLASSTAGVCELVGDTWQATDAVDIRTLATTYGTVLRGVDPGIQVPKDAVTELFREGTPPAVNKAWVTWAAAAYRAWVMSDPTEWR